LSLTGTGDFRRRFLLKGLNEAMGAEDLESKGKSAPPHAGPGAGRNIRKDFS
jgi:hypothetical protein